MEESVKISLKKYEKLIHGDKMFNDYIHNALIVKDKKGRIESFICNEQNDRLNQLSTMNDKIYKALIKAENRNKKNHYRIEDLEYINELKDFEIDRIRGVRKFYKIFAIVGLVSCAFLVAYLMSYLLRLV